MSSDTNDTYITGVVDQLSTAVAAGDAVQAERIVDQVDADGHTAAAAILGQALADTSIGDQLADE
jgi:hypothetical protein